MVNPEKKTRVLTKVDPGAKDQHVRYDLCSMLVRHVVGLGLNARKT